MWPQNPTNICVNEFICLEIFEYSNIYSNICNVSILKPQQIDFFLFHSLHPKPFPPKKKFKIFY